MGNCNEFDFRSGKYIKWCYEYNKTSWFWRINVGLLAAYCMFIFCVGLYMFGMNPRGMDGFEYLEMVVPLFALILNNFKKLLMPLVDAGPIMTDELDCIIFNRTLINLLTLRPTMLLSRSSRSPFSGTRAGIRP